MRNFIAANRPLSFAMALAAAGGLWLFALGSKPDSHGVAKNQVAVPPYMRACASDEDCGHVETSCSACCQYIGINKTYIEDYFAAVFGPACRRYRGAVCDCAFGFEEHKPACVNGICTLAGTRN